MSESVKKPPNPRTHRAFDARFVAEESSVRRSARAEEAGDREDEQTAPGNAQPEDAAGLGETIGERATRIARKIEVAERILANLDRTDPHHRMLTSAVFRRDEVLLDAVLRACAKRR